jgi:hypothetical protein
MRSIELRCAIAHLRSGPQRKIEYQFCRFGPSRNDKESKTHSRILAARPARVVHESLSLKSRGRRESRARDAPAASRPKNRKDTSVVTTGLPERSGLPCANGFNGFFRALSGDRAFLPPSPRNAKHCRELTPASRRQDHTTSPSAYWCIRLAHQKRPSHPASTSVTIAIRPSCEAGRRNQ